MAKSTWINLAGLAEDEKLGTPKDRGHCHANPYPSQSISQDPLYGNQSQNTGFSSLPQSSSDTVYYSDGSTKVICVYTKAHSMWQYGGTVTIYAGSPPYYGRNLSIESTTHHVASAECSMRTSWISLLNPLPHYSSISGTGASFTELSFCGVKWLNNDVLFHIQFHGRSPSLLHSNFSIRHRQDRPGFGFSKSTRLFSHNWFMWQQHSTISLDSICYACRSLFEPRIIVIFARQSVSSIFGRQAPVFHAG